MNSDRFVMLLQLAAAMHPELSGLRDWALLEAAKEIGYPDENKAATA